MIIRVDYHYKSSILFDDDAAEFEDSRGYFYKIAEDRKKCFRFQFDNLDDFFNFFLNDFSDTVEDNSDDFEACVITFSCKK